MRKVMVVGIIVLFLLVGVYPSLAIDMVNKSVDPLNSGNTLYVGGSGSGNYSKIQDAINDAYDGDTVFVYNGTYYENIKVSKSISLIGEDKNSTVINCKGTGRVHISADDVNISNITVTKCSSYGSIMIWYCDSVTVEDCIIYNTDASGFHLYYTNHNEITDCYINNSKNDGIFIAKTTWSTIRNCTISHNKEDGIFMWSRSTNNIVKNCVVKHNR